MQTSELLEKLKQIKEKYGELPMYMSCINTTDVNYVCVCINTYDKSYEIHLVDNLEGFEAKKNCLGFSHVIDF